MRDFRFEIDIDLNSFNLVHIFECGQCFRWEKEEEFENSYIGIIKDTVLRVSIDGNKLICEGVTLLDNIEEYLYNYFDLKTDYNMLKNKLSKIDEHLKTSIKFGYGIRILNQDLWETIISFIISANNNIPRIKKIINSISKEYGNKIVFEGKEYYSFPNPEALSKATVQDLRTLGLGFRDIRVYNTTRMILNNEINLENLYKEKDINFVKDELLKLDGVGEKVADCIMLFSLRRYDAFPVDVWVRRVMNDLYIHNEDEEKVNKKMFREYAYDKFGDIAGIAQQYLFYWKREIS